MASIGNIELPAPFVLAPLAGVSDLSFRLMSREQGCPFAFIEMISVHALTHTNRKTMQLLRTVPEDRPLGIQILGRDEEHIKRAMDIILPMGYDSIDLNAACPVKKVAKRGEGAALMKEPEALQRALSTVVRNSNVPVTIKIRAGWDTDSVNAPGIARMAEDAGASAIFVHGRTRAQQYKGTVDYSTIREVKAAVSIPVFGSGDVFSAELALRMMSETGCDGAVMARGAMGNPWIFREAIAAWRAEPIPPRPTIDEVADVMTRHLDMCIEQYGPASAVKVYRKFFIWYTKGLGNVKVLRLAAVRSSSIQEMRTHIEQIRSTATQTA